MARKQILIGTVALAVVAAGALWWWRSASAAPSPAIDSVSLERGRITQSITATGVLSPLKSVQVGSQVSGRIQELTVDFNARVTKGQVLARLDPQLFKAQVERAGANLQAARADLTRARALAADAKAQATRDQALLDQGLVATAEAQTSAASARAQRAQVTAAEAQVAQATASLREAELNLTYTTIYSPIDGVVISRAVDVGQTVAASLQAPTLFTLAEDLGKMQVNTAVAESDVGRLREGMAVSFTVDAHPGREFPGTVRQVRNVATTTANVVTYDAVIDVMNPDLLLKPGMTANVTFIVADVADTLRLPNAALRFRPTPEVLTALGAVAPTRAARAPGRGAGAGNEANRKTVWKLDGSRPVAVRVELGISDGAFTQVIGGELAVGDRLVTDVDLGTEAPSTTRAPTTPGSPMGGGRPPGGGGLGMGGGGGGRGGGR
jgi:HlyD family secretion protein